MKRIRDLSQLLGKQVDGASLAAFRINFGLMMLLELWQAFRLDRIHRYYVAPKLLFPYYGFGWLERLPERGFYCLFYGLALLAVLITLGLFSRVAALLFCVGYSYLFLLDQTNYQNHLYLICLLALLLSVVDAQRVWSLDAWRKKDDARCVPAWQVGLIALQIGVVYAFGGVNKLSAEWFSGASLGLELAHRGREWGIDILTLPLTARAFAFSGMLLDLSAVPLLCWRRTRPFMYAVLVVFHLSNSQLFSIGIFPWFMLLGTTIFFAPDWPRRLLRQRREVLVTPRPVLPLAGPRLALLAGYALLQLLVPLRHHLYPGNMAWTSDAEYFSWTMKLNVREGAARLFLDDAQGKSREISLPYFLTAKQLRHLTYTPDMVVAFSRYIAARVPKGSGQRLRWESMLSLNGRPPQRFIIADGERVARQVISWRPTRIVEPLSQPLPSTDGQSVARNE